MGVDLAPSEYRDMELPYELVSEPEGDLPARVLLGFMTAFVVIFLLAGSAITWSVIQAGKSLGGPIFILVCGCVMLAGCLATYQYLRAGSTMTIKITKESIWVGLREVSWASVTAPVIEEIEQEQGPSDYQVTFCVIGDRTFGAWPHFNPRSYVVAKGISAVCAADIFCQCLGEARRRALANEFDVPAASMPVHAFLRIKPAPNS